MTEALKSVEPIARASVEERVGGGAARADRQRASCRRARRSCSATSPSGSASRRRRSGSGSRARARRPRRGRRHRPRARQPADARGPRGDLRGAARARRARCARRRRGGRRRPSSRGCGRCSRELERLAKRQDVDGYLRARWEFHAACYEASGRPRLVAEVERLFWRAERYNRLVLSSRERFRALGRATTARFFEACKAGDAGGRRARRSTSRRSGRST